MVGNGTEVGPYARAVAERVLVLQMSRTMSRRIWIGGLVFAAACVLLSVAVWKAEPLVGVPIGLLLASFPLLVHLDAVELDGDLLSVRRGIRWVGPVDLRNVVGLGYRPMAYRRPAVWLLIQREAGPRLRWHRLIGIEREVRQHLAEQCGLQVIEVAAGSSISEVPGLAEHLAERVLGSGAVVEERARAALARSIRRSGDRSAG